jgi:hypothetical protein
MPCIHHQSRDMQQIFLSLTEKERGVAIDEQGESVDEWDESPEKRPCRWEHACGFGAGEVGFGGFCCMSAC